MNSSGKPIGKASHPVRVRGLKQGSEGGDYDEEDVAPRAGAWVETIKSACRFPAAKVAPRAGAWVETRLQLDVTITGLSHPVRVRGLKLCIISTLITHLQRRTPCGCVG